MSIGLIVAFRQKNLLEILKSGPIDVDPNNAYLLEGLGHAALELLIVHRLPMALNLLYELHSLLRDAVRYDLRCQLLQGLPREDGLGIQGQVGFRRYFRLVVPAARNIIFNKGFCPVLKITIREEKLWTDRGLPLYD